MSSRHKTLMGSLLLIFSLTSFTSLLRGEVLAKTPLEEVRQTIMEVQQVVSDGASVSEAQRKESLRQVLLLRFDWAEMARRVLGKHWNDIAPRQAEFVDVFQDFLGDAYAGRIISFRDEKVLFVRESVDKSQAQVDTKIVPTKGEPVTVNYWLHRVQEEWKIHDVVIEHISVVSYYRAQFDRVLERGSFDDLLKRLRALAPIARD